MAKYKWTCPTCGPAKYVIRDKGAVACSCGQQCEPIHEPHGGITMVESKIRGVRFTVGDVQAIQDGNYSGSV